MTYKIPPFFEGVTNIASYLADYFGRSATSDLVTAYVLDTGGWDFTSDATRSLSLPDFDLKRIIGVSEYYDTDPNHTPSQYRNYNRMTTYLDYSANTIVLSPDPAHVTTAFDDDSFNRGKVTLWVEN